MVFQSLAELGVLPSLVLAAYLHMTMMVMMMIFFTMIMVTVTEMMPALEWLFTHDADADDHGDIADTKCSLVTYND